MVELIDCDMESCIRSSAPSLKDAFVESVRYLFTIMADTAAFKKDITLEIECTAGNQRELLVNFHNALLFEAAVHHAIFTDFEIVELGETHLKVTASGEKIKLAHKNALKTEIKAASFKNARIYERDSLVFTECLLHI